MQIDFSKDEYRTFLGILEIADWILFAHQTDKPQDRKHYQDFEQKIFAYAEAFGASDLIVYDEKYKQYFPTREYDENSPVRPFIDEFENDCFWTELAERLSDRDMLRELGEKKIRRMTAQERFMTHQEFEQKYQEEFEKHGIDRLQIKGT